MAGVSAGTAFVDVEPNLKNFTSKLSGDLNKHAKAVGRTAAIAGGAIVAGLAIGAKKAIDAASDMGETISKVETVFQKSGKEMIAWGDTTARQLGIGKKEALDAAAIFGVFGQAAGLTGDQLTKFSKPLVQAAADLASFHNVPVTEALDALRSGLAGETEPLRRFGILLNDAALKEEALRQGLIKNTQDALSPQNKMLAAQALILKSLGAAQGDFARTSDSAANKQKINAAVTADLTAKIGAGLLPAYTKLLDLGLRVVTHFSSNTTHAKLLAIGIGILGTALLALAVSIKIATAAALLFNAPLLLTAGIAFGVIVGLVAIGVALVVLWRKYETFRNIVGAAIDFVRNHWKLLLALIPGIGPLLVVIISKFGTIRAVGAAAFNAVRAAVGFVIDKVGAAVSKVSDFIGKVKNVTGGPFNAVKEAVGNVIEKVGNAIGRVGDFIGKVKNVTAGPFETVKNALASIVGFLKSAISLLGSMASKIASLPSLPNLPSLPGFLGGGGGGGGGAGGGGGTAGAFRGGGAAAPVSTASRSALRGVWNNYAQRYFPGQRMPNVVVGGLKGGYQYGYVPFSEGPGQRTIHLSKMTMDAATGPARAREWFRTTFLHEIAHAFQSTKTIARGRSFVEGGADVFATLADRLQRTTPREGFFYPKMSSAIMERMGANWGLKGQFLDSGGFLPPGLSLAYNGTGMPERVLSPKQPGPGVTVEQMNIRTAVDIDLVAAALYRKALATG